MTPRTLAQISRTAVSKTTGCRIANCENCAARAKYIAAACREYAAQGNTEADDRWVIKHDGDKLYLAFPDGEPVNEHHLEALGGEDSIVEVRRVDRTAAALAAAEGE